MDTIIKSIKNKPYGLLILKENGKTYKHKTTKNVLSSITLLFFNLANEL